MMLDFWAKLRAQLTEHEGRRLELYTDTVGKVTGGVGHNFTDNGISPAVCDLMLDEDIGRAINDLKTFRWFNGLDDMRQRVLVDLVFNIGLPRLRGFRLMLAAVEAGDFEEASQQMLDSLWAHQVGHRAIRLAQMMATGREAA